MKINDVDQPMGNAELRLSLAGIESEIAEVKGIAMETREQAKKTNGAVASLKLWRSYIVGFCACLFLFIVSIGIPLLAALLTTHK